MALLFNRTYLLLHLDSIAFSLKATAIYACSKETFIFIWPSGLFIWSQWLKKVSDNGSGATACHLFFSMKCALRSTSKEIALQSGPEPDCVAENVFFIYTNPHRHWRINHMHFFFLKIDDLVIMTWTVQWARGNVTNKKPWPLSLKTWYKINMFMKVTCNGSPENV